ncbi:MAG: amidohydrolase family protein [Oscillibacter sp.]|jgi:guanine deaminase|nr:amidohydrolase family protein [Oscillibacter sp.]
MAKNIYRGDVVFSADAEHLHITEGGYLVVEDGFIIGLFTKLPEEYAGLPVTDYGRGLIIPAFSDLHIHASQYVQRGIGMDKLLFDWLSDYTFPQEARFASMEYAKPVYDAVVKDLIRHGTFHASLFTTIHYDASAYLFQALEGAGLSAYVGKVNMDCNSPEFLCEDTDDSLRETERFLAEHQGGKTVRPILTPRFAPTCSERLIKGLGKLAQRYHCGIQTHLCESLAEVDSTLKLFPGYRADAEIYQKAGLLDYGPSIFAHFIFPSALDLEILHSNRSMTVHCPDATTNITAGIMPVGAFHDQGLPISLGSDVAGGQSVAVYRQVARSVQMSKLKAFYEPECNHAITFPQAFYMATKAGGSCFDRVGSLEKGFRFDALVLDHLEDAGIPLTPAERLERFCYAGDDRNITARYLGGRELAFD